MTYESEIEVLPILTATLHLLEDTRYPEKLSSSLNSLIAHMRQYIAELEASKMPPASEKVARIDADKRHRYNPTR